MRIAFCRGVTFDKPSYSQEALGECLFSRESEANEEMRLIGSCKGLRFRWAPNLFITYRLEKSLLQTAKRRSALRRRENNERNQKLIERVDWWASSIKMRRWSQNPQNMVIPRSNFEVIFFSDRYNLFKDTFHWNVVVVEKNAIKLKHLLFSTGHPDCVGVR